MKGHLINKNKSNLSTEHTNTKYNLDLIEIKKIYKKNVHSKLTINGNNNTREIIFQNEDSLSIIISNPKFFDNIILPELLNTYLDYNKKLTQEKLITNSTNNSYQANNNLFIQYHEKNTLTHIVDYIKQLNKNKKEKYHKNSPYYYQEPIPEINNNQINYGYISILLIAFITSLITIVICLIKFNFT